jgi:uncharacterized membrane protein YdjX (TVP38/TMEM64 family)
MPEADAQHQTIPPATRRSGAGALATKIVLGLIAVAVLIVIGRQLGGYIPVFAEWVDSLGYLGPVVFILGYAAATLAFVPGSLLTMAAGAIFGLSKGTLYVFIGATLGTALAFLVSRYVARGTIEKKLEGKPKFAAIDSAVSKSGLKIVFLLRLSPAFPYNLLNYALGLTSVKFSDYVLASFGMLPGTFLYVYYGKIIGSLAAVTSGTEVDGGAERWVFVVIGLVATIAVTTVITKIARRALNEEVDSD